MNLGSQDFIQAYSKSKHFDPKTPDAELHVDKVTKKGRDEIGLIRTLCVKVCLCVCALDPPEA